MRIKPFCLIPLFSLVFFACGEKMVVKPYNEGLHIIPEPERITQQTGEFVLNPNTLLLSIMIRSMRLPVILNTR